jgi:hypothetical protein
MTQTAAVLESSSPPPLLPKSSQPPMHASCLHDLAAKAISALLQRPDLLRRLPDEAQQQLLLSVAPRVRQHPTLLGDAAALMLLLEMNVVAAVGLRKEQERRQGVAKGGKAATSLPSQKTLKPSGGGAPRAGKRARAPDSTAAGAAASAACEAVMSAPAEVIASRLAQHLEASRQLLADVGALGLGQRVDAAAYTPGTGKPTSGAATAPPLGSTASLF